ncbi:MAG: hypothetical protein QNK37_20690 [Acidobacteriota bacterium]|nr:hypothetical protein [Acidobacteriota bacterium]
MQIHYAEALQNNLDALLEPFGTLRRKVDSSELPRILPVIAGDVTPDDQPEHRAISVLIELTAESETALTLLRGNVEQALFTHDDWSFTVIDIEYVGFNLSRIDDETGSTTLDLGSGVLSLDIIAQIQPGEPFI